MPVIPGHRLWAEPGGGHACRHLPGPLRGQQPGLGPWVFRSCGLGCGWRLAAGSL